MPHFGEPTPEGPGKRRFCRITTGTYTGDGAATQQIRGVGFQPKFVIVYRQFNAVGDIAHKSDQDGTMTKYVDFTIGQTTYADDHIISLDPDGFTVGDGTLDANRFNINLQVYTYIAFG